MEEKTCIAIDVGGTKMLIAQVRDDGTVLKMKRYPTGRLTQPELVKRMKDGVLDFEASVGWEGGKRPAQMGIGIVGIIDPVHGIWNRIDQEYAEETPLAKIMEDEFRVECHIDNDVKSATIAERMFGAGKGCNDLLYINVGTGLAAGAIAGGRLIRGSGGFAGEIGYMNFNMGEGPHIELIASGVGINHRIHSLLQQYPDSALKDLAGGVVSGQTVFELADAGDRLAVRLLDDVVTVTALLISNLTCVLAPERVVLGGGLISSGRLFERIVGSLNQSICAHIMGGITLSALDPAYTGLIGAAAVGFGYQKLFF